MRTVQQGFTLVEVLVAVFVLAIGLLGVAGLQMTSLKANQSAYFRSQATLAAYDMIDRMRTNPLGVQASVYDSVTVDAASLPTVDPACINQTTGCSPSNLAKTDILEWATNHVALLPSGKGSVSRSGDVFTVTISWSEQGKTLDTKSIKLNVQL